MTADGQWVMWLLISLPLLFGLASEALAGSPVPKVELLWPDGAPGAVGNEDSDKPSLSIHLPPAGRANGAAVIICPGGAYCTLGIVHEGHDVARWLNSLGAVGFVLKYRFAPLYHHPTPLLDAQRAVRVVRARAAEWQVDAKRIGIMGFSAGGHLASTVGTHFDDGKKDAEDPIEQVSCRPDFMILVYPVISFTTPYMHAGSKNHLFGRNPDPGLFGSLSSEKQVTPRTPPTFLMHASDDWQVLSENSILFYMALHKASVPAEIHIYERGGHGFGLAPGQWLLSSWAERCAAWMSARGLLRRNT